MTWTNSTVTTRTTLTTIGTSSRRLTVVGLAVVGLVVALAHGAALPQTLEDLDSVNFALGVEAFDVSAHRPHPPGYPLYIAAGRVTTAAVMAVAPQWPRDRRAAVGLALWSVGAATVGVWVLYAFWMAVGLTSTQAALAATLAVVSPLFWLTAGRPLSDVPGLVAALAVQAPLLVGLRMFRAAPQGTLSPMWWWAAAGAGLIIGLRTQTMWLTGPLLCVCAWQLAAHGRWRDVVWLVGSAAAGVLVWFIPLVVVSGGWTAYLTMLGSQGAHDFMGVEMLATRPSWLLLVAALRRTFVTPWLHESLAWVVLGLAAAGAIWLVWRSRPVLALVVVAFVPYSVFHLAFQETATIRYSLPLLVPIAGLAVVALSVLRRPMALIASVLLVLTSVWVAQPALAAYGRDGAPIFRALRDLDVPTVGMHGRIASEARQALVWVRETKPLTVLPIDPGAEVKAVVDYWRTGAPGPVWFLANPVRRDLALIDPRSTTLHARYVWHPETRMLLAIARPTDVDVWVMTPPRWMLRRGWAVTPEIGGVTSALGLGPHRAPAEAYLRRDPAPLRVVIGGRHLSDGSFTPKTLVARLDGREVSRWQIAPSDPHFLQWIDLPAGVPTGAGPYATLSVGVEGRRRSRPIGLEFFDAATYDDVLWVYGPGWHEPEQQPGTGLSWRWMSGRAQLVVAAPPGDLTLTVTGESPHRYFATGSDVVVRLGTREVGRRHIIDDFTEAFTLPAADLAASGGVVTLDVSETYVPADREESADRRKLGLRVFEVRIEPIVR